MKIGERAKELQLMILKVVLMKINLNKMQIYCEEFCIIHSVFWARLSANHDNVMNIYVVDRDYQKE
jgi:hypothetical protein